MRCQDFGQRFEPKNLDFAFKISSIMPLPNSAISQFLQATRPRTYPIAIVSLMISQSLAYRSLGGFGFDEWLVAILAIYTALSLQILSNLANDYGDGVRGTDSLRHADSPARLVGSGTVSFERFRAWLLTWLVQTIVAGGVLIWLSPLTLVQVVLFFGLGAVSILGALGYTMGKRPYGYHALGEVAVLIFFGYVAVLGGYYLQMGRVDITQNLPIATGVGLLSACVMYINNLRDVKTDKLSGKMTLAVVLGRYCIAGYLGLLSVAVLCYFVHFYRSGGVGAWLLGLLPLFWHIYQVMRDKDDPVRLGKQLKNIMMLVVAFGGLVLLN